ncbi:unnamed protein product [Aspergillus oryzae]|uniref:Vacuolar transporter chaperone complex subunit 4 n=1 Tax=Aspergillus oryzae TaxID=5062 RepID=A0AAN5BRQ4_ASPOZ|nr:unnamed protein product [Aspergillus oryzae]
MIKEYYWYYIAYDELKRALRTDFVAEPVPSYAKRDRKPWTEEDEKHFVSLLEGGLEKVFNFQRMKSEEIVRRIQSSEKEVNDVVSRLESATASGSRRQSVRSNIHPPSDEDFLVLEQVLSDIIADVHDLAKFTQLNYTGFQKIIKKHDHLPVLVFNPQKEFEEEDTAITSIYYDNPDTWELYQGRLKKTEGAEAIRLRWYGGMKSDQIFVERKTHREDWTGEKSVKARFSLKEKNVNAYLAGELTTDTIFDKMRKEGKKSEEEINNLEQLAQEIQYRVITRQLKPVTRTFYHRTAFQLPGDARVRISLDTELTMVREDNLDGHRRSGDNWRRMDIGVDFPFSQLPPEDVERFPYAVLEVKLQTQAGQEPPQWIRDLTASHLVEAVPKFSKFIHGTATLFPDRINLLPFWMPQMDVDIRKPAMRRFGIERPLASTSLSANETPEDEYDSDEDELDDRQGLTNGDRRGPRNDLFADSDGNTLDIEERIAAQPLPGDEDYPLYDSDEEDTIDADELEEARRVGGMHYYRQLAKYYAQQTGSAVVSGLIALIPRPRPTNLPPPEQRGIAVMGNKRTPKVYFAAERTFLSWLEFSILLGTIAATLLNFGNDYITFASSWAFTVLAALALLYSLVLYIWRVDKIRKRRDVKRVYYEKWGPTVVGVGLAVVLLVNFILRARQAGFTERDDYPGNGQGSDSGEL